MRSMYLLVVGYLTLIFHSAKSKDNTFSIVFLTNNIHTVESFSHFDTLTEVDIIPTNTSINLTLKHLKPADYGVFKMHALLCQYVRNGAILFVADMPCGDLSQIASLLKEVHVPLLNVNEDCLEPAHNDSSYFNFETPRREFKYGVSYALANTGWNDVLLIRDFNDGGSGADVSAALMENNVTAVTFHVEDTAVSDILQHVFDDDISNIVVSCSLSCMREVLHTAVVKDYSGQYQGLFTHHAKFLFITDYPQMKLLEGYLEDLDHVSVVVPYVHHENITDVLQMIYDMAVTGLMMTESAVTPEPSSVCGERSQLAAYMYDHIMDSFDMSPCGNCTEYAVYAAAYLQQRERQLQLVGVLTREGYTSFAPVFPNVLHGFNGRHFHVGTNVWGPFVSEKENTTIGFTGLCVQLLIELSLNLNFTFALSMPEDMGWGVSEGGNWTGLVGMLQRRDADMVVAPLAANVDRESVMDFTEAFYLDYTAVLVRYTDLNAGKWRLYLQPFRWESWICFAVAIPVGAFFIWLVTRLTPYYPSHGKKKCSEAYQGLGTFRNALLSTFGAFFQQGSIWLPEAQSVRFIVGFWWMYCIVVMATYSGNLIAYLTVTKTELPFDTLEEMVGADNFKFGTMGGTVTEHLLRQARSGVEREIWKKIRKWAKSDKSILSSNQTHQIDRVLSEKYAYINDRTGFELEMSRTCDVGLVSEYFLPSEYSVGLQNHSFFKHELSEDIVKIKESGLINKLKAEFWPRPSFCTTGMQTEAKPVSLIDVQGAYYAMAILLAMASISLIGEAVLKFLRGRVFNARRSKGHSGGYQDELPNGTTQPRHSEYFEFQSGDSHDQRSVRKQSEKQRENGVTGDTSEYMNGSTPPTTGIWTYSNTRAELYTYNTVDKNLV